MRLAQSSDSRRTATARPPGQHGPARQGINPAPPPRPVHVVGLLVLLLLAVASTCSPNPTSAPRRNFLHIIADDLRPELDLYGVPYRHTPTLDALASHPNSVTFATAFAQQAVCAPSRVSFLTGRHPSTSKCWNFIDSFRDPHSLSANWTTLPGLFKAHNYLSLGAGKVFHPQIPAAYDGTASWSPEALTPGFHNPCWNSAADPSIPRSLQDGGLPCVFCPVDIEHYLGHGNVTVGNEFCALDALEDTLTIDRAVEQLRALPPGQPFYMAVGLHKPHMPWQYSPEDLAKHPLENISLPLHRYPPTDMPALAFHMTDSEIHSDPFVAPVGDADTRAGRRAYRAAVTGMDRKLSHLLAELAALGLDNNTAIVFHSDHGFQLGENGLWRKMTNFELATRVPLIIKVPWLKPAPGGRRSEAVVSLIDLYPTLAELAELPLPAGETLEGRSLVPLLGAEPADDALFNVSFSQYPRLVRDPSRAWDHNDIIHSNRSDYTHLGLSVRTPRFRYTEWRLFNRSVLAADWTQPPAAVELYTHFEPPLPYNPDAYETANLASNASYADTIHQLAAILRQQFAK